MTTETETGTEGVARQAMDVDIACVGFGPATAGFLMTLSRRLADAVPPAPREPGDAGDAAPGALLRAGRRRRLRGLRGGHPRRGRSGPPSPTSTRPQIPMATPVKDEKVLYLLDPVGASRRSAALRAADRTLRTLKPLLKVEDARRRAALDPGLPAQDRRPGLLHGPVQPVDGRPGDGHRHGPGLARHPGGRGADRGDRPSRASGCSTRAWTGRGGPRAAVTCRAWTSTPA